MSTGTRNEIPRPCGSGYRTKETRPLQRANRYAATVVSLEKGGTHGVFYCPATTASVISPLLAWVYKGTSTLTIY